MWMTNMFLTRLLCYLFGSFCKGMTLYLYIKRLCPTKRGTVYLIDRFLCKALDRFYYFHSDRWLGKIRAQMSKWVNKNPLALDSVKVLLYFVDCGFGDAFVIS